MCTVGVFHELEGDELEMLDAIDIEVVGAFNAGIAFGVGVSVSAATNLASDSVTSVAIRGNDVAPPALRLTSHQRANASSPTK